MANTSITPGTMTPVGSGGSSVPGTTVLPSGIDGAGIQAAIDAAAAGDILMLPNERVDITGSAGLYFDHSVDLIGHPGGLSEIYTSADISISGSSVMVVVANYHLGDAYDISCHFDNFTMTQERRETALDSGVYRCNFFWLSNHCNGIEFSNMTFNHGSSNIVNIQAYDNTAYDGMTVRNISFHDNVLNEWWESILILAAGSLDGCTIYNNTGTCNSVHWNGAVSNPYGFALDVEDSYGTIQNVTITDNHIDARGASAGMANGMGFSMSTSFPRTRPHCFQNVVVSNNYFGGFTWGTLVAAFNTDASKPANLTIENNTYEAPVINCIKIAVNNESGGGGNPKGHVDDYLAILNNKFISFTERSVAYDLTYAPDLNVRDEGTTVEEPVTTVDLTTGLTAMWHFDSGSWLDETANNCDLTASGTVTQGVGIRGGANTCAVFAGGGLLSGPSNFSALKVGDFNWTLALWVYFTSLADQVIVNQNDTSQFAWSLSLASGVLFYEATTNGVNTGGQYFTLTSAVPITTATWYCIFVQFQADGNFLALRVNQNPRETASYPNQGVHASTAPLIFGGRNIGGSPSLYFNGRIDQAAFWKSKHLTQLEMDAYYNDRYSRTYSGITTPPEPNELKYQLSAFWAMDESSGNRADSQGSNTLVNHSVGSIAGKEVGSTAAQFTGANYLTIVSNSTIVPNPDFTLTFLFRPDAIPGGTSEKILAAKAPTSGSTWEWIVQYVYRGTVEFYLHDSGGTYNVAQSEVLFGTSNWHFIACVYDSSIKRGRLYVDNVLVSVSDKALPTGLVGGGNTLAFGAYADGSQGVQASMQRVTYHQRILGTDQLTRMYNAGDALTYAEL